MHGIRATSSFLKDVKTRLVILLAISPDEKPDGQMKKLLDTTRMKEYIDISPVEVEEGIKQTVEWYTLNKEEADAKK